ncbi:MAG TPA: hypothetical protein VGK26_02245 [Thermoanaerobaculia bacterium]|jgi:hypothetical protein
MRIPSTRVWLLSALVLLAVPAVARLSHGVGEQLRLPATPLDRTSASGTRQWAFLQECRGRVPPRASLTVVAADPEAESALFMLALGLYPDHPVWPSSYFGSPVDSGSHAQYVLIFDGATPPPGLEIVAQWDGGAIGRRRRSLMP